MLVAVLLMGRVCCHQRESFFVLIQQRICLTARALRAQFARSIEGDVLSFFNRAGMDEM